jgi:hypothetical protein
MQTEAAGEPPNSFNGIQFGAVRGKKVQVKFAGLFFAPPLVGSRMMVGSVIGDNHDTLTVTATGLAQLL